jgi:hypothetical protein
MVGLKSFPKIEHANIIIKQMGSIKKRNKFSQQFYSI